MRPKWRVILVVAVVLVAILAYAVGMTFVLIP